MPIPKVLFRSNRGSGCGSGGSSRSSCSRGVSAGVLIYV